MFKDEGKITIYPMVPMNMMLFENKMGIYCLIYDNEIVYIGQSINIGRRLREHKNKNAIKKTIQHIIREKGQINRYKELALYSCIEDNYNDFYFAVLKLTDELIKYEKYYIEKYQPKFNYQGVNIPY